MSSDIITKAVRLLHSSSKESSEQLRALLDQCLTQRKITKQIPINKKPPSSVSAPIVTPVDSKPQPVSDAEACVVCKLTTKTTNNQVVECQECHSLYHQECHKPSLIDQNISDPRFVWYCSQCIQNRKKAKLMAKTKTKSAPAADDTAVESRQTKVTPTNSSTSFFSPWPLPSNRWNSSSNKESGSKRSESSKQSNEST